eukprot:gene9639-17401_t
MIDNASNVRWPPAVEDLKAEERKPPRSLIKFLILLLHSTHHSAEDEVHCHSLSIAQDLVHAVSKRKFTTLKHTLLGTALHSLIGQRLAVDILATFGNSCNYDLVQRIKTAQAELDIADCDLTVEERGTKMREDFCIRMDPAEKERQLFFDPIKRAPWKSFADQSLKSKVRSKSKEKEKDVTVQRDILKLQTELAKKVIREIPKTYESIYIPCDAYRAATMKDGERCTRGEGDKFVIRNSDIRIPADFKKFLSNGENNERMFEVWVKEEEYGKDTICVVRFSS